MRPSRLLLVIAALWGVGAAGAIFWPPMLHWWGWAGAVIAAVMLLDGARGRMLEPLEAERSLPGALAVGAEMTVKIRLTHMARSGPIRLYDHHPPTFAVTGMPREVRVRAGQWAEVSYTARAHERGEQRFGRVELLRRSPWGLWWLRQYCGTSQQVRVYPNFHTVAKFALLAREDRLGELGLHKHQRRGTGTEFHQLREYRAGDSLRQIDWRATSRMRRVISREYQEERDQQVVFLLDQGRRMRSKDGDLGHLDHALNAVLLLSYVALRQGDAVGLMSYGGEPRWIAPRKGPAFVNVISNATYDLQPTLRVGDIRGASELLLHRLRKRSLVVVISNVRDDAPNEFLPVLRLARRRHVVVIASLRERVVDDVLGREPRRFSEALRLAGTHRLLQARASAHRRLERSGALVVDSYPRDLPSRLVDLYLAIKRTGRL